MSSLVSSSNAVGASTAIFGLIGYYVRITSINSNIDIIPRFELAHNGLKSEMRNDYVHRYYTSYELYDG